MKKTVTFILYISVLQISAGDGMSIRNNNDNDDLLNGQAVGLLAASSKDQGPVPGEVHIDMQQLEKSLFTDQTTAPFSPAIAFNSSKDIAQYLTQVLYGETIAQPTFLTGPVREQLKKIKTENPIKHQRLIDQLADHQKKATRGINLTGATEALQKEITPEMVGLFVDAWQASHAQQTGTITQQELDARTARIKFWCAVGTTLVGIGSTAIAAIFAGTGTC